MSDNAKDNPCPQIDSKDTNSEQRWFCLECGSCGHKFPYLAIRYPATVHGAPSPQTEGGAAISGGPHHRGEGWAVPPTGTPEEESGVVQCPGKVEAKKCGTWNLFDIDFTTTTPQCVGRPLIESQATTYTNWIAKRDENIRDQAKQFYTEGKSFNTLFTAFFGVYTAILVFFGLSTSEGTSATLGSFPPWIKGLFFVPLIFWLVGVFFLTQVMRPTITDEIADSPESILYNYHQASVEKASSFRWGILSFGAGILCIILAVGAGIVSPPETAPFENRTVQLAISDTGYPFIHRLPLAMNAQNVTDPVLLTNITENDYQIQLTSGIQMNVKKEWVDSVIYLQGDTTASEKETAEPTPTTALPEEETGEPPASPSPSETTQGAG
jgi:hypothetical protein